MNPFDQALKELNLTFAQTELIKQAVEEFVIGDNERIPQSESGIDLGMITGITPRNKLRDAQRQALRGTK